MQSNQQSTRASTLQDDTLASTARQGEFSALSYQEEFEEIKCIGRGNFGAAFLVRHKNPPPDATEVYFIAKKIVYAQLNEKEKEQSFLESMLLRNLSHPHIVGYKTSFVDKGELIIIMEFCESKYHWVENNLQYFYSG